MQRYDLVYVSQVTYLTQQTLLPDLARTVTALAAALSQPTSQLPAASRPPAAATGAAAGVSPLILVDGYHGFGALPCPGLAPAYACEEVASGTVGLGYMAGCLKHLGCGPNAAFVTLSPAWEARPLVTGASTQPSRH